MSVFALTVVKSSCLADLPLAGGLLVGVSALRVFEAPKLLLRTCLAGPYEPIPMSGRQGERLSEEQASRLAAHRLGWLAGWKG